MLPWTNYLSNAKMLRFVAKIVPSLLGATGTAILTAMINTRGDESFTNVATGISPSYLTYTAIAVDIVHLISLLAMVYWADPEYVQSLSDEKIVDVLIQMNKIDDNIDISCSWKASDIIREAITDIDSFDVFKKDIQEQITKPRHYKSYNRKNCFMKASRALQDAMFQYGIGDAELEEEEGSGEAG